MSALEQISQILDNDPSTSDTLYDIRRIIEKERLADEHFHLSKDERLKGVHAMLETAYEDDDVSALYAAKELLEKLF